VATAARLADVGGVHGRRCVARFDDLMLAVAIGAKRGLRDALGEGLAVNTGPVLFGDRGVAHAAGIGHRHSEGLRAGRQQLMRTAVAEAAIGRGLIAVLASLAVDTAFVIAGLIGVARAALRLGNARLVRVRVMRLMTGIASQTRVRALSEFLRLVVTTGTIERGSRGPTTTGGPEN